jgi:hypothetical protein
VALRTCSEDCQLQRGPDDATAKDHPPHGQLPVEAHQRRKRGDGEERGRHVDHTGIDDVDGDCGDQPDDRGGDTE